MSYWFIISIDRVSVQLSNAIRRFSPAIFGAAISEVVETKIATSPKESFRQISAYTVDDIGASFIGV